MKVLEIIGFQPGKSRKIPMFVMSVSAGLPVEADSEIDKHIDLNEFLVEHPAATFFAKVNGNSLKNIGVDDGDILVVDTAVEPEDGKLVVVTINDDLTVKMYREIDGEVVLQSHSDQYLPIKIAPYLEYQIIGVVTKSIHSF